jgi:hypothetical protein
MYIPKTCGTQPRVGRHYMKRVLLAVAVLLFWASFAKADSGDSTVYTYTGNPLDDPGTFINQPTCTCNITGELTFAQPLDLPTNIDQVTGTPTSYSFSVDGYTLTQANSAIQNFSIGELNWGLDILGQNGLTIFITCSHGCGDDGGATDWAGFNTDQTPATIGVTVGHRGTWTVSMPEPLTFPMLSAGIFILFLKRHQGSKL